VTATTRPASPPVPERMGPFAADVEAIKATVLDYYEGWYDADAERMTRAVHPDLVKRARTDHDGPDGVSRVVTAEQMIAWTEAGRGREDAIGGDRTVEVEVYGVAGDIASAIAATPLYHEYLLLVATSDGWRIVLALWRFQDGQPHQP
jgi:hypothetical protein